MSYSVTGTTNMSEGKGYYERIRVEFQDGRS